MSESPKPDALKSLFEILSNAAAIQFQLNKKFLFLNFSYSAGKAMFEEEKNKAIWLELNWQSSLYDFSSR